MLVVDDEPGMLSFIERALSPRFARVDCAANAEMGQTLVNKNHYDIIVLDISLPGKTGLNWLQDLRASGFVGDVILITGYADMETAISALRAGAQDFLQKPFRIDQLWNSVDRITDRSNLLRENFVLRRAVNTDQSLEHALIGESPLARQLRSVVARVAKTDATVLFTGESGVGKEVAARYLHANSLRSKKPFVPVNCAAISAELIESELFGHVKGAFTGATDHHHGLFYYAQGGTLFLDEIGELPLPMQTKLLRVLEDRKVRPVGSTKEVDVDVRIVVATNRQLKVEVDRGRFRQDLFYRLDVMPVEIPALRYRSEDVAMLAQYFITQLSTKLRVESVPFTHEVKDRLIAYDWPGNVRELRNFIERSLILGYYPIETLPVTWQEESESVGAASEVPTDFCESLEAVEKRHILSVLQDVEGNKSEAARRLGVSRKTLERKTALWGMT